MQIYPVNSTNWPDFELLFEERGGPKNCWCMIWRYYTKSDEANDKNNRKTGMRDRVLSGVHVGLIGYIDDKPVAWCSVAPRQNFTKSLDGKSSVVDEGKWSLTCLFIKSAHRSKGLSDILIEEAVNYSRSKGATILEAYPVAADSPSYRFCGFDSQFERHGFKVIGRVGLRRNVAVKTF